MFKLAVACNFKVLELRLSLLLLCCCLLVAQGPDARLHYKETNLAELALDVRVGGVQLESCDVIRGCAAEELVLL